MKPYGIRRSDNVRWKCCPGHDNRERKYLIRKLWNGEPGRPDSNTNAKNRDRARKKHARQGGKQEIRTQEINFMEYFEDLLDLYTEGYDDLLFGRPDEWYDDQVIPNVTLNGGPIYKGDFENV
jgi:hypothetical protein